jgi:hypothetical protein
LHAQYNFLSPVPSHRSAVKPNQFFTRNVGNQTHGYFAFDKFHDLFRKNKKVHVMSWKKMHRYVSICFENYIQQTVRYRNLDLFYLNLIFFNLATTLLNVTTEHFDA